jgi:hypothetical protein
MDNTIIAAIIGSATTLAGVVAAHILSKGHRRRKDFAQTSIEFNEAFHESILNLENAEHSVCWILNEFFWDHKFAMMNFRLHLHPKKLERFNRSWHLYQRFRYEHKQTHDDPSTFLASPNTPYEEENRRKMRTHIESILKFTIK